MTKNEFMAICEAETVNPAIALENEDVRIALAMGEDEVVIEIIKNL